MNLEQPRRRTLLGRGAMLALSAIAFPTALLSLSACDRAALPGSMGGNKTAFKSLDLTGADYGRKLDLPDFNGQPRHLSDFAGKLVVLFFGYTQCPDVCPTTLADLAETQKLLGADGDKLMGLFVTLDPERDTAELLKAYVGQFNPDWLALRGDADQTSAAAKEFKIFYRKVPGQTETSYTLDHTAASYVFDTHGRLRLYVRHATPPAELAADLKTLLAQKD